MARRNKSAVERYHDRVAGRYDDIYDDAYWQWHDALTWDHIKAHLPRSTELPLLDLGCGTGKWALKLVKSGFRVTCVDISLAMLEQTRRKFEELGQSGKVEFVQADLAALSALPAHGFAAAVALGDPIGCTASPPKALKAIYRALSPGGLLMATFDNRWAAIDHYVQQGSTADLEEFLKTGRMHWLTRERGEQFPIWTWSPGQLQHDLERAGFEVVDLIGKTVLPMRRHRHLLEDGRQRRQWAELEKRVWRDPAAMGRAAHLQVVARTRGSDAPSDKPGPGMDDLVPPTV